MSRESDEGQLSKSVFSRFALVQSLILIGVMVALGLSFRSTARDRYVETVTSNLGDLTQVLSKQIPRKFKDKLESEWCKRVSKESGFWVSLISSVDGHMYCDTVYDPGTYPGVIDRPEIKSAIESPDRKGGSVRISPNFGPTQGVYSTLFFPARQLVIRVGLPLKPLEEDLAWFDRVFSATILLLAIASVLILQWTTRGFLFRRAEIAVSKREKKLKEDFVANVSHEFRTPLTSILGFANASLRKIKDGKSPDREFMEIIQKDSKRLLGMVNDLLDLSALDSGGMELHREIVNLDEIVDEVSQRLEMVHGTKKIQILRKFEDPEIYADPERLHQILLNLVGNAMKYCPEGSSVEIASRKTETFTELVVSDDGPGLPERTRENLFKRFAKGTQPEARSGAGLGLAIVKGLIEAHGGSIELKEGSGTGFLMKFPLNEA